MNAICLICSELLKSEDIVSTICGHIFHRCCLTNWLVSSRTCPTCRSECTSSSLIKLFFEVDDNKSIYLNFDDILKTNDELIQQLKQEQEKNKCFEELKTALKEANEKTKAMERQKQLDDMAIAGLKCIKDESSDEIVKLNQHLNTLKLDLLAEKQLRRIQQLSLHNFDPENENYDTLTIKIDETKPQPGSLDSDEPMNLSNGTSKSAIIPFWKLSCEAKPVPTVESNNSAPYIIPSKIQKAQKVKDPSRTSTDKLLAFRTQKSSWNLIDEKPVGFQFKAPNVTSPSTSANVSNKTQKRSFGEGFAFFSSVKNESTSPSISSSSFNFNPDVPAFQSTSEATASSTSSPTANGFASTPFRILAGVSIHTGLTTRYREPESPPLSDRLRKDGNGPKSSDR